MRRSERPAAAASLATGAGPNSFQVRQPLVEAGVESLTGWSAISVSLSADR